MTATLYERMTPDQQAFFDGPGSHASRNIVMSCFYGPQPFEIISIFEMIVLPRAQILRALHELIESEEIVQVPDCMVPTFRRSNAWEAA